MNRYKTYLDDKPGPKKKSTQQLSEEIAAFLTKGGKVNEVPRGATGIGPVSISRSIIKKGENQ